MNSEAREAARKLAEAVSSTLSDEERAQFGRSAFYVAKSLRKTMDEAESTEEVVVWLSHTICRMLAELEQTPLSLVSDFCEQNMGAYALAAGGIAGVYALPGEEAAPGGLEAEVVPITRRADEQIGQYL